MEEKNGKLGAVVVSPPPGYVVHDAYVVYVADELVEEPPVAKVRNQDRAFELPDYARAVEQLAGYYGGEVLVSKTESLTRTKGGEEPRRHIATIITIDSKASAAVKAKVQKPSDKQVPTIMASLAREALSPETIAKAGERKMNPKDLAREVVAARYGITVDELKELVSQYL